MTYTVSYKKLGSFFWTTIKNVKGDLIATDLPHPARILILQDESKIEVPMVEGMLFKFSKERFIVIKQNMEKESGQKLNIG
jgi:hypothetical protein